MLSLHFPRPSAVLLTVFAALLTGCGDSPSGPGSGSSSTGTTTTTTPDESASTVDVPMPVGNSEPPLEAAAAEAASAAPAESDGQAQASDTESVTLQVVSPDEFNAIVAKHKGKVVLVDFWASWCVPCRKAFPRTVALGKKHADDGLVVISMCFDDADAREDALEFLKANDAKFENLMCRFGGETESFEAYEIGDAGLPYFRVYDRGGVLKHAFKNDVDGGKGIDEAQVHAAVEDLLKSANARDVSE